jgi:formate C-acetyltransferase
MAKDELSKLKLYTKKDLKKKFFLEGVMIALSAIIEFARRYADLARELLEKESDPERRAVLLKIYEACNWVPENPARSFHEAIQSFWLIYLMCNPSPTIGMGRFDQYMYPFYKKDRDEGKITDEEVIDLLCELRRKDMSLIRIALRPEKRKQHAGVGQAKWHNMVIGGVDREGKDATNELTYLILEAAKNVRTPHHTITLRVHDGTPEDLMLKAIEVVKTGIGMPAFVGDKSYIEFLLSQGVPLDLARNYVVAGCIEASIPGHSRQSKCTFFVFPKVLEVFINGGRDERTGLELGPFKIEVERFQSFEDMYEAFKKYLVYFTKLAAELINIDLACVTEFSSPVDSMLMADAVREGKGIFERKMTYENGAAMSQCGLVNVADSLAAIKKLVFEEKLFTMKDIKEALRKNWEGYEEMRKMCLKAPKYGNDDDYVDSLVADLYKTWENTLSSIHTIWGESFKTAGISITSQWAGGAITGATPDGRYAGEVLADGGASPMRGRDVCGPTAIIKSASKIDQIGLQSVLLNMKFHPSSLRSYEDMKKLASLIKTYFSLGGKHVQFNVIDRQTLLDAQKNPEKYRDLVVRVAGFSAYFVQLSKEVQDEIIARTELSV